MKVVFLALALLTTNSLIAQSCNPGEAGIGGVAPCFPCTAGRYQNISGQDSCLPCPAGTYQDQIGQMSCNVCEAGTFSSNEESIECFSCPAGTSSAHGASSCTLVSSEAGGGCGAITDIRIKQHYRFDILFLLSVLFILTIGIRKLIERSLLKRIF